MQCFVLYRVKRIPHSNIRTILVENLLSVLLKLAYTMIMLTLLMVIFFMTNSGKGREDLRSMTYELSEHGTNGFVVVSGQYSSHFF